MSSVSLETFYIYSSTVKSEIFGGHRNEDGSHVGREGTARSEGTRLETSGEEDMTAVEKEYEEVLGRPKDGSFVIGSEKTSPLETCTKT